MLDSVGLAEGMGTHWLCMWPVSLDVPWPVSLAGLPVISTIEHGAHQERVLLLKQGIFILVNSLVTAITNLVPSSHHCNLPLTPSLSKKLLADLKGTNLPYQNLPPKEIPHTPLRTGAATIMTVTHNPGNKPKMTAITFRHYHPIFPLIIQARCCRMGLFSPYPGGRVHIHCTPTWPHHTIHHRQGVWNVQVGPISSKRLNLPYSGGESHPIWHTQRQ